MIRIITFLLLLVSTASSFATSLQDLQNQNKLKISSEIVTKGKLLPSQQVTLTISIDTDRWFAGGTFISGFDLKHAMVMQRENLASNTSYVDNRNVTWTSQKWDISIYPMSSGKYLIPRIPVTVSIATENGDSVKGTLYTEPVTFTVDDPSTDPDIELPIGTHWFSASKFALDQSWDIGDKINLKVGDSIARTVHLHAQDTTIGLLPNWKTFTNDKIQSYASPVKAEDKSLRGDNIANKTMTQTYILQKGGKLTIPAVTFYWWNDHTHKMLKETVDGRTFIIHNTFASFMRVYWAGVLIVLIIIAVIIFYITRLMQAIKNETAPNVWLFRKALKAQDYQTANRYLYNELQDRTGQLELRKAADNDEVKTAVDTWSEPLYRDDQSNPTIEQQGVFKRLWTLVIQFTSKPKTKLGKKVAEIKRYLDGPKL